MCFQKPFHRCNVLHENAGSRRGLLDRFVFLEAVHRPQSDAHHQQHRPAVARRLVGRLGRSGLHAAGAGATHLHVPANDAPNGGQEKGGQGKGRAGREGGQQ